MKQLHITDDHIKKLIAAHIDKLMTKPLFEQARNALELWKESTDEADKEDALYAVLMCAAKLATQHPTSAPHLSRAIVLARSVFFLTVDPHQKKTAQVMKETYQTLCRNQLTQPNPKPNSLQPHYKL